MKQRIEDPLRPVIKFGIRQPRKKERKEKKKKKERKKER